jgi:hypothetical protein
MRERVVSTSGYDPGMALSADERTLYYESRVSPSCPSGGDAAACDVYSIVLIDLDTGAPTTATSIPPNCGYGRLAPLGEADVLVTCPYTSETYDVLSSGATEKIATFLGGYPVVFGGKVDGRPFLLAGDGRVLFDDGTTVRILDSSQHIEQWSSTQLASGALLVAYSGAEETYDNTGMPMVESVQIIDPLQPAFAKSYALPADISYVYPLPGDRLALLNRNAATIEIDALTPTGLAKERTFPSDATWIAY